MSSSVSLTIVVAADQGGIIGNRGTLPWHHPADMRHFRELTGHCPVIVGRATMDDIVARAAGKRVLPTRQPVVVSRRPYPGYPSAPTVAEALAIAGPLSTGQVMVIGGARVYGEALELQETRTIHLTRVPGVHEGDVSVPAGWLEGWARVDRQEGPDGLVFTTWWRAEHAARARAEAAARFCFCAGMAWRSHREEECRAAADRVIGGPLRARIGELEAEVERLRVCAAIAGHGVDPGGYYAGTAGARLRELEATAERAHTEASEMADWAGHNVNKLRAVRALRDQWAGRPGFAEIADALDAVLDEPPAAPASTPPERKPFVPCELPTPGGEWCARRIGHIGDCNPTRPIGGPA